MIDRENIIIQKEWSFVFSTTFITIYFNFLSISNNPLKKSNFLYRKAFNNFIIVDFFARWILNFQTVGRKELLLWFLLLLMWCVDMLKRDVVKTSCRNVFCCVVLEIEKGKNWPTVRSVLLSYLLPSPTLT